MNKLCADNIQKQLLRAAFKKIRQKFHIIFSLNSMGLYRRSCISLRYERDPILRYSILMVFFLR